MNGLFVICVASRRVDIQKPGPAQVSLYQEHLLMSTWFKRASPVDVLLVEVVVEVVGHEGRVAQALQDGVHVAGVPHVPQSRKRGPQTAERRVHVTDLGGRQPGDLGFRSGRDARRPRENPTTLLTNKLLEEFHKLFPLFYLF